MLAPTTVGDLTAVDTRIITIISQLNHVDMVIYEYLLSKFLEHLNTLVGFEDELAVLRQTRHARDQECPLSRLAMAKSHTLGHDALLLETSCEIEVVNTKDFLELFLSLNTNPKPQS